MIKLLSNKVYNLTLIFTLELILVAMWNRFDFGSNVESILVNIKATHGKIDFTLKLINSYHRKTIQTLRFCYLNKANELSISNIYACGVSL